jgi:hypothetical protein
MGTNCGKTRRTLSRKVLGKEWGWEIPCSGHKIPCSAAKNSLLGRQKFPARGVQGNSTQAIEFAAEFTAERLRNQPNEQISL